MRLGPPEMKPMIAVLEMEPDGNGSWAIHGIVQDGKGRVRPSPSNQPTDGSLLVVLDGKMARVVEGRNAAIHRNSIRTSKEFNTKLQTEQKENKIFFILFYSYHYHYYNYSFVSQKRHPSILTSQSNCSFVPFQLPLNTPVILP